MGNVVEPDGPARRHATLLHALSATATRAPEVGITIVPDRDSAPERFRSYQALAQAARNVAGHLQAHAIAEGERVLVVLPTSHDFAVAFFGVLLAGGIPTPAYPPTGLHLELGVGRLVSIASHAKARICITNRRIKGVLGDLHNRTEHIAHLMTVEDLAEPAQEPSPFEARPNGPAMLQYTSGSTGTPKGVLLSHANLIANTHAIGTVIETQSTDVVVSWLPMYHDMGLGALLFSVYWGVPLVLMSPLAFVMRPSRWLWAIHRHRGTLSPSPNFAYALCVKKVNAAERDGLDLSSWRIAWNGAEAVDLRTLHDFEQTYGHFGFRTETMYPVYGLAESSLAVTSPAPGAPRKIARVDRSHLARGHAAPSSEPSAAEFVSLGPALPDHEIRIVDDAARPLEDLQVGQILVRGPSVMLGYLDAPFETRQALRGEWLWTGDLGFMLAGELYVTGRAKDLIIVRGRNHYPEDIERVADRIDGVRVGNTVAFGVPDDEQGTEAVVLVCETRIEDEEARNALVDRITEAVSAVTQLVLKDVVLVAAGTLPKTSSGKKQRNLVRQYYLDGTLGERLTGRFRNAIAYVRSAAGLVRGRLRKILGGRRARSGNT